MLALQEPEALCSLQESLGAPVGSRAGQPVLTRLEAVEAEVGGQRRLLQVGCGHGCLDSCLGSAHAVCPVLHALHCLWRMVHPGPVVPLPCHTMGLLGRMR